MYRTKDTLVLTGIRASSGTLFLPNYVSQRRNEYEIVEVTTTPYAKRMLSDEHSSTKRGTRPREQTAE